MIENARETRMRCYISSSFLVDTGPLRSVLHDLNVEFGSIEEFPPAGQELITVARAQIQSASFVVGVISHGQSGAVLFELGLAMGLGKTVFLIAENKDDLPSSMFGLPLVVAPVTDRETLRFHLEAFLASLKLPRKVVAATPRPARFYGGGEAIPIKPRSGFADAEAEIRIQAAFVGAGAQVTVGQRFGAKSEADMIVWLSEPELASVGPLLVEVKAKAKQPFPVKAMDQIRRLLESSHLRTALIVTDAPDPGLSGRIIDGAFVYTISIAELERIAGAGQLGLELKRVRNLLAHGAA